MTVGSETAPQAHDGTQGSVPYVQIVYRTNSHMGLLRQGLCTMEKKAAAARPPPSCSEGCRRSCTGRHAEVWMSGCCSGRCCAGCRREQVAGQRVLDGRTAVLPSSAQHVGSDLLALVNAAHSTPGSRGKTWTGSKRRSLHRNGEMSRALRTGSL